MVRPYLEIKKIAVENEKIMREKKVLAECAATGESRQVVEERFKNADKRCPDLPPYKVSDDYLTEDGAVNEH